MITKEHGLTGQRNALKSDATSHLHVRVNSQDKALWVKAAAPGKLSEWVINTLNEKATNDK